jgi:hypothetical protein
MSDVAWACRAAESRGVRTRSLVPSSGQVGDTREVVASLVCVRGDGSARGRCRRAAGLVELVSDSCDGSRN